jgi:shikimate kinase
MKTSLAMIGFMGTGKTAVGRVLAARLGKEFIELDSLIEQKAGKSIPEIFRQDGEIGFRELEIEVIKEIVDKKNVVIACGGGVVLNKINIDRLKKECVIVYLTASPAVILKRTSGDKNERPLLDVSDRTKKIKELLRFRQPFYERAADVIINTTGLDIESVAARIVEKLREDEDYR